MDGAKSLYFYEDDRLIIAFSSLAAIHSIRTNLGIDRQLFKD